MTTTAPGVIADVESGVRFSRGDNESPPTALATGVRDDRLYRGPSPRCRLVGRVMAYFRVYVLDPKNRQLAAINLNAEHKLAAIEYARGLMIADSPWFAFEIWQNARQVHKELRSDSDRMHAPAPVARSVTHLKIMKSGRSE